MESFLYCYHLPSINSIKIGFGDDPKSRMLRYTKVYQLEADKRSLKSWSLPISGIASHVERACHETFESLGMHQKNISVEQSEAQEVFDLFDITYSEAVKIVEEILQEQVEILIVKLGDKSKNLHQQSQREAAKRKYLDRVKKDHEEAERLIYECSRIIQNDLVPKIFVPLCLALNKGTLLMAKVPPVPKKGLFNFGKKTPNSDDMFYSWERRGDLIDIIIEVFHLDRKLRFSQLRLEKDYYDAPVGLTVDAAAELVKVDFWCPCAKHTYNHFQILYSDEDYMTKSLVAREEVVHAIMGVTDLTRNMAERILNETPDLRKLQAYACKNLPPELMSEFSSLISKFDMNYARLLKQS